MTPDKNAETVAPSKTKAQLPVNLPLEFIPLYDWWTKNGIQFIVQAGIVVIVVGSILGGKYYYQNRVATANKELLKASTTEELEALVGNYGAWKIGNTARLRLAKSYYDAGKYEDALETYNACINKGAPVGFSAVAVMGRAICFEALDRTDEALAAYTAFIDNNPKHFLVMQAKMGQARVMTLQGKTEQGQKLLETLKAEKNSDPMAEMAIAQLQGVIARYEVRKAVFPTDTSRVPVAVPAVAPVQPKAK